MELPTNVFELYKLTINKNICVSLLQSVIMIPSWKVCDNGHEMPLIVWRVGGVIRVTVD